MSSRWYDMWVDKYGKDEADRRQEELNKKISESKKGSIPWNKGKVGLQSHTEEFCLEAKKRWMGENNPMRRPDVIAKFKGKKRPDVSNRNKENSSMKNLESRKKVSESNKKTWSSPEIREKARLRRLKEIKEKHGQCIPNYNSVACGIINNYNKKYGFNFQHAENGGEKCIGGYFPDGVDEKRKTIIEIDEKHHFNPDGTFKQKDIRRQKHLEDLGYKFIRIKI